WPETAPTVEAPSPVSGESTARVSERDSSAAAARTPAAVWNPGSRPSAVAIGWTPSDTGAGELGVEESEGGVSDSSGPVGRGSETPTCSLMSLDESRSAPVVDLR